MRRQGRSGGIAVVLALAVGCAASACTTQVDQRQTTSSHDSADSPSALGAAEGFISAWGLPDGEARTRAFARYASPELAKLMSSVPATTAPRGRDQLHQLSASDSRVEFETLAVPRTYRLLVAKSGGNWVVIGIAGLAVSSPSA